MNNKNETRSLPEQVDVLVVGNGPVGATMAALLGALPLALGTGTGSELRQPIGVTIVGGLIVSQLLTLYTTPVVYLYLDRLNAWCKSKWRKWHGAHTPPLAPDIPH